MGVFLGVWPTKTRTLSLQTLGFWNKQYFVDIDHAHKPHPFLLWYLIVFSVRTILYQPTYHHSISTLISPDRCPFSSTSSLRHCTILCFLRLFDTSLAGDVWPQPFVRFSPDQASFQARLGQRHCLRCQQRWCHRFAGFTLLFCAKQ